MILIDQLGGASSIHSYYLLLLLQFNDSKKKLPGLSQPWRIGVVLAESQFARTGSSFLSQWILFHYVYNVVFCARLV